MTVKLVSKNYYDIIMHVNAAHFCKNKCNSLLHNLGVQIRTLKCHSDISVHHQKANQPSSKEENMSTVFDKLGIPIEIFSSQ